MKQKLEIIKKYILPVVLILVCVFIIVECRTQVKYIKYYLRKIQNTGTQISFVVPFINKNIANDTLFTIAIGNNVLANGITNMDTLTWHENLEFPHSGIFDVIIATIYNKFDFGGIYVYTILMAVFIFVALAYTIYHACKNKWITLLISIWVMYFASAVFVARAQEISFLLFILEFLCIENLLETGKKRYGVLLIIIPILIANFHSSVFPVYFILYLPYIAEFILAEIGLKIKKLEIEKRENIKKLFIVFGISLFTGFCTTTGLAPYTDMFKAMAGESTSFIGELSNSTWSNNQPFFVIAIAVIAMIIFGKEKIKITDIFYILGFGAMTLVAYRCFFFFLFLASMPIARITTDFLKEHGNFKNSKYIKASVLGFSLLLYILLATVSFFRLQGDEYIEDYLYPVEACDYILENVEMENMRIYNGFNWGSYMEFRGIKAFIDSRSGMFCEEFNEGITILKDWLAVYYGETDYSEVFEKYDITHVLAQNSEVFKEKLDADSSWKTIYSDDYFTLYEKK